MFMGGDVKESYFIIILDNVSWEGKGRESSITVNLIMLVGGDVRESYFIIILDNV